ncbi:MAG: hypothetical protein ACAI44_40545 [Candidatus Sericytochromatia bacterium]
MFVARWSVDIRFGHKDEALVLMRKWQDEVGKQAGWEESNLRILNGSVGVAESRLEYELQVGSLAELEQIWAKLPEIPSHRQFGKDLEPLIVSGSNHWQIFRVVPRS